MNTSEAAAETGLGFDSSAFETFLAGRQEPDWVTAGRREAFEIFQKKQLEPLDPEEWKRVDLRRFRPERFSIQSSASAEEDSSANDFETGLARQEAARWGGVVHHVDGHCSRKSLSEDLASRGVVFGDLSELVHTHGELLRPVLMKRAVQSETDRFSAWHAAFWTGGTVLIVPRGVEISEPLHSLIALSRDSAADLSHTLVVLEDGASATLLEETMSASTSNAGLHVGAVELLIGRGAQLRYVQLQDWNQKVFHFAHQAGHVAADGSLQWTVSGLGGRLAHIHQDVALDGRGARAEVNGVCFVTERQLLSYFTHQQHNAADTESDLLYKEVLRDRSRMVWRGMIRVEPESQRINGFQRSDALMLSDTCRSDAVPGLEIEADDVHCSHAATTGRVDEEQIFYCMSRGIHRREAMHMIVEGFFQDVYDRIPIESVRDTLSTAVASKLGILE